MPIQRLLSTTQVKEQKKAGAELCQAQVKLGLAKPTLLKKTVFIFLKINLLFTVLSLSWFAVLFTKTINISLQSAIYLYYICVLSNP